MDIERLKELKGITEHLYQDGNVPLTYCDDVLGTIDEAIARQSDKHPMAGTDPDADDWGNGYSRGYADGLQICQSVKSEEVAEAIDMLQAIRPSENEIKSGEYPDVADAIDLAITALQSYQPTTRKNRTVEEAAISKTETTSNSCWYCKGIELHNIKSVKTVTDESDRELGAYDTPYNFCPNCGRKLEG